MKKILNYVRRWIFVSQSCLSSIFKCVDPDPQHWFKCSVATYYNLTKEPYDGSAIIHNTKQKGGTTTVQPILVLGSRSRQ